MPQQVSGDVLRPDLYVLAKAFDEKAAAMGYVGLQIMPLERVTSPNGIYAKMTAEQLMKRAETARAPRSGYNRIDTSFGSASYSCKEYGLEGVVDDSFAKQYENYIDSEMVVQNQVLQTMALEQEIRHRDIVYAETAHAVTNPWSTYASATPRDDVNDAIETVRKRCGLKPDTLVLTEKKLHDVLKTAAFIDNAKYTINPLVLPMEAKIGLARMYLEVPRILIAGGIVNSANEGLSFVGADIWDNDKGFLFISGSGFAGGPHYGVTINYVEDSITGTETYYESQTRGTVIRNRTWRYEAVMNSTAGWKLTNL
jgi:hypothetical protein